LNFGNSSLDLGGGFRCYLLKAQPSIFLTIAGLIQKWLDELVLKACELLKIAE